MFGYFLDQGSFDNLKGLLTHKQTYFLIILSNIDNHHHPNNLVKELGCGSFNHSY
jgi:hypothetical protein